MTQRERESLTELDPHTLLFGHDDDATPEDESSTPRHMTRSAERRARNDHAQHRRRKRHRRAFAVLVTVVVAIVVVIVGYGYHLYQGRYHPADYSGAGTGSVLVTVDDGDGAKDIATTLAHEHVVRSVRAFTNAAADDARSQGVSSGTYRLREHMSATSALGLLLDPTARVSRQVVVFEGATVLDVTAPLAKALGVSPSAVTSALGDVRALGLPRGYTGVSGAPPSVEGFLYPATYSFDPGTRLGDALQQMITQFTDRARSTDFTADAKARKLTPYQALIIASIAEKEAKVAADYPKVARVILNRIAAKKPLQIDATSAYAAKLRKLDPTKVVYATIDSPYNTYTHDGLPPTPIANPGSAAMDAAVHPAGGNWLYYVNGDAKGDLYFTDSEAAFGKAVQRCRAHHWGCG